MYLSGLGTAVPRWRYSQAECWEALRHSAPFRELKERSRTILRKVLLGDNGISTRHLALPDLTHAFRMDPDSLQQRFEKHAADLADKAARKALADAGIRAGEVGAVIVSTCTGYMCPGLSSYVAERLGLATRVRALDLVGQGCGAALPNAAMAASLIAGDATNHVLSVCVEVCSAAMYLDDDPGVLISACLFSDGAAAAVWSKAQPAGRRHVEWIDQESRLSPSDREALRFEHRGGRLRNILRPEVPEVAARELAGVLGTLLARNHLESADVRAWVLHAGGRKVLEAIAGKLALDETEIQASASVLDRYGNLSSPFVYFVLEHALSKVTPPGWWCFSSFGAGFSCGAAILKVH